MTGRAERPTRHEGLPGWVPEAARHYLAHTEAGLPIRHLARVSGCHASTVLRQVRRTEARRDDPLVDAALRHLGRLHFPVADPGGRKEARAMKDDAQQTPPVCGIDETTLARESRRVLRRLAEPGSVLAVAEGMEKAVIVRDTPSGTSTRTAVLDAAVAQALALKDWVSCRKPGRIAKYVITGAGRTELARLMAAPGDGAEADESEDGPEAPEASRQGGRRHRYCAEAPLIALARRREKDGTRFLSDELVAAGERLREDFELAQSGPRVTQDWNRFLTAGSAGFRPGEAPSRGPEAARARLAAALRERLPDHWDGRR
ncbi:MAG: DUF6456 domain-containing protein, partial [Paracoccaceae bacterium]